ncbi:post-GPI attachment to proteins factor 2-like [Dreissena polymorpha]|nr:post-GPI attachment to proteins factor 2-like [Dreissena polymorpha]
MEKNTLCYVKASHLGYFTMGLPGLATFIAIAYSILYDFKGSTATHCNVRNILPTVSACISRCPQCYIWRIFIALHAAPRFMFAAAWYNWYMQVQVGKSQALYGLLVKITIGLHVVENLMLVTLTCVSSLENRNIHENSFVLFMACSWLVFLLSIVLSKWGNRTHPEDRKSYMLKKLFAVINIASFSLALYSYFRHNAYCEPYVYSWFAFFEYVTIYSNILFHGTATIDVREYSAGLVLTDLLRKHK